MKYAVIESGGKQYIAREGETIEVDRLPIEVGKSITFKEILLVVDNGKTKVGNPYVKGVTIKGTVVAEVKAPKIIVFKYIPRERYRRKQGHRQRYSRVLIDSIGVRSTSKVAETEEPKKETKPAPKKETAAKPKPAAKKKAAAKPAAKKSTTEAKSAKPKSTTAKSSTKATTSKSTTKKSTTTKSTATKSKTSTTKSKSSTKKPSTKTTKTKKSSTKSSDKSSTSKSKK
jgi:large subunit ribosomal protein L21